MACGAVLKFNHDGFLGLIYYFLGDWRTFEGWCVAQGCDPLKESGLRAISLMMYYVEKDLTEKGREQFRHSIENPSMNQLVKQAAKKQRESSAKVEVKPGKKWKAPEGWTPPGWDEKKSFAAAKAFMGFNASPK